MAKSLLGLNLNASSLFGLVYCPSSIRMTMYSLSSINDLLFNALLLFLITSFDDFT